MLRQVTPELSGQPSNITLGTLRPTRLNAHEQARRSKALAIPASRGRSGVRAWGGQALGLLYLLSGSSRGRCTRKSRTTTAT